MKTGIHTEQQQLASQFSARKEALKKTSILTIIKHVDDTRVVWTGAQINNQTDINYRVWQKKSFVNCWVNMSRIKILETLKYPQEPKNSSPFFCNFERHTVSKVIFLFKNWILMKSNKSFNLNFCAKIQ